jgi:hypothetical protein
MLFLHHHIPPLSLSSAAEKRSDTEAPSQKLRGIPSKIYKIPEKLILTQLKLPEKKE